MTTPTAALPAGAALPGITLRGLTKSYGATEVLTDVTATLTPGRIYGLLGANGTGKTTLLACIAGHTFRTGGEILIDGQDPREHAPTLARLCFVHEDQAYNDAFSVADILAVMPAFYPDWDPDTATRLVRRFRIPRRTRSRKLSRGQRSALAITLALASGAAYTFLDEPYLGLDATARGIFYDELLAAYAASHEQAASGASAPRTFVMSTHLIDEAAELIEEVLVLEGGRIVLQADVDDARRTAFLARGFEADVLALAVGREVLSTRRLGGILTATIRGDLSVDDRRRATEARVSIEPTTLQELVAAIGQHGESDQPAPHYATESSPVQ
jgi:ABC-2 type transport system ATP-binding protein